jgi:D-glycero-D-manno-heptose 1,7-bisphosphate phosphatase
MSHAAIFLDRDGTLVYPSHYPSRLEQMRLYEDIAPELSRLQHMGFRLIVITNETGIAHGYFEEAALHRMHEHLTRELMKQGVRLDGIYYCPHHPDGIVEQFAVRCICRKPQPGMILRAAKERDIDLSRSWFVGDILDDVEAGNRAGCRTVLVDLGTEQTPTTAMRCPTYISRSTRQALQMIRATESSSGIAAQPRKGIVKRGISHVLQQRRQSSTATRNMIYCPSSRQPGWNTPDIPTAIISRQAGVAHGYRC